MKELKPYYHRRLPHYQPKDSILFVTFRLANSLPKNVVVQLLQEREQREINITCEKNREKKQILLQEEGRRYFGHFDSYLDRVMTEIHWLANPVVAEVVKNSILFYDQKVYEVVVFCIMSNHVHLVLNMEKTNVPLHSILQRVKSYSARKANSLLEMKGIFWQRENYDHVVRNSEELKRIVRYVMENPLKAGLCKTWSD
ncbi:MAG: transposase [Bacteroidota bacterium]